MPSGSKISLLHELGEVLARERAHQRFDQGESIVAIHREFAGLVLQVRLRQRVHRVLYVPGDRHEAESVSIVAARHARCVREQVAHRDAGEGWRAHAQRRQKLDDRLLQRQLAPVAKDHHGQCRQHLGDRTDVDAHLGRCRKSALAVGMAKGLLPDHAVVGQQGDRDGCRAAVASA
jgi:hypothetical protein